MEMIDVKLQLPKDLVKVVVTPDAQLETALWQRLVFDLYREERISLGKACELLGITKWEFADLLKEKDVALPYDEDDLDEDLNALKDLNLMIVKPDELPPE